MNELLLSPKFKSYLKDDDFSFEFLESCTYSGKTTVGAIKAILQMVESKKKYHVLAALDLGVAERNIINKEMGIIDVFGDLIKYYPNGKGETSFPHLLLKTNDIEKVIYVLGYSDSVKWRKVLGSQFGIVFIDEANQADISFIQEITMRCDKAIFTQNPDDPSILFYKQYVNHSRPRPEYRGDYPPELLDMLNETPKEKWVHWYFNFSDNPSLDEEKRNKIIEAVPKGTKQYFTKILGLRRKTSGLVFSNFEPCKHVKRKEWIKEMLASGEMQWQVLSAGLDTAYSASSADTIAMTYWGITVSGVLVELDERVYNNANLDTPLAPSDTVINFVDFLDRNVGEWGFARNVFIDSADQATITEFKKYKREHGSPYNFNGAWKKTKVIDRINMALGWLAKEQYIILNHCTNSIHEMEVYAWVENKDNEPEDRNDHTINSGQYAWLPYKQIIGVEKQEERRY